MKQYLIEHLSIVEQAGKHLATSRAWRYTEQLLGRLIEIDTAAASIQNDYSQGQQIKSRQQRIRIAPPLGVGRFSL